MAMQNNLTRRKLLGGAVVVGGGAIASPVSAAPAQTANASAIAAASLTALNRLPHMMQEYYVGRVREVSAARLRAIEALKTKADAEGYVGHVRERIRDCFGPPPPKTPLKPRITGTLDRDAYRVDKLIFESRPGFLVTANLYVPKSAKTPMPGVVAPVGHEADGKAGGSDQAFGQSLARQGYIVLIYDPIGQAERSQYVGADWKPRRRMGTSEHIYEGNQQYLVGEFFGHWRAWDGIRALDYLLSRPDVDPARVGVTGCSGGGTLTTWLCGLERRWTMAAPSCFVTSFLHDLENELPSDTEQCPPRVLHNGLEEEDFIVAMAPKPVILLTSEQDFFDTRGTEEALGRLKRIYELLGAPANIAMFRGPGPHGYSKPQREAMYHWFGRATGLAAPAAEPAVEIEPAEQLWCSPHGQVAELKSRPIFEFTRDAARSLAAQRGQPSGEELRNRITEVLRLAPRGTAPHYRILRALRDRGYPHTYASVYLVETEPGILIPAYRLSRFQLLSRPTPNEPNAVLYVAHRSADDELRREPLIPKLITENSEVPLYACDVRGIGESMPQTCALNSFDNAYGSDYFNSVYGIMLDSPYTGQKTFDVLRVLDWMAACGHRSIHLVGRGWGAIPAALAAVLSPHVARVTLKNAPESYHLIATSEDYNWPLSTLPPGILKSFDLPDCYRELKPKQLELLEPWGAAPEDA